MIESNLPAINRKGQGRQTKPKKLSKSLFNPTKEKTNA
jgi:hypothetical protein